MAVLPVPVRADGLPAIERSSQLVLVVGNSWSSTDGALRRYERHDPASQWTQVGNVIPISTGFKGYAWGIGLQPEEAAEPKLGEWDLRSPAGVFRVPFAFGQIDMPADLKIPYKRIDNSSFCVDDPNSVYYNQIVSRPEIATPDWRSAEPMGGDRGYRIGIMIAQNSGNPAVPSRGSCIFLHPGPTHGGTNGCTTTDYREIQRIILWLDSSKNPLIVQLPKEEYDRRKAAWSLP